jgi:hypothetical protein
MELITILNRCHRFRGFVYERAHFSADKKNIEVAVRPRKGSTAGLLALPFAGARLRGLVGLALQGGIHRAIARPRWNAPER